MGEVLRWAGNARPLALPLGELARLKAVTERAGMHLVISMRWAGSARPLALPLGELARLKAVTERAYAVTNMEKVA